MPLVCPRCEKGKLEEIEVEGVLLDRCTTCAGLWFDSGEIFELVGRREELKKLEATIPGPDAAQDEMRCPRCVDVPLRVLRDHCDEDGDSTLPLFRCVSCSGTWMDRGALNPFQDLRLAQDVASYVQKVCRD